MAYLGEFRLNWRPVTAAAFGLGAGVSLTTFVASLFVPALGKEFGWTGAQFALTSLGLILAMIGVLIAGRLADTFGARRVAAVGVIVLPLCYAAFSRMGGDILEYYAIFGVLMFVGATTSATVYTRVVVARFSAARGLALAIAASGAPVVGAVLSPVLTGIIADHGWRTGYLALAAVTALFGLTALALLPGETAEQTAARRAPTGTAKAYGLVLRSPAAWAILGGMFLCNLPSIVTGYQFKPMLVSLGIGSAEAAWLISLYAIGVIAGRFACGLALDRFPAHIVAAFGMGVPGFGFALIAGQPDGLWAFAVAVGLMGLSQGAEQDIGAYLAAGWFPRDVYSTVFGMITASIVAAGAAGGPILSMLLGWSPSFVPFLAGSAVSVLVGGSLFLLLGRRRSGLATAVAET